jgi:hypothetical protein
VVEDEDVPPVDPDVLGVYPELPPDDPDPPPPDGVVGAGSGPVGIGTLTDKPPTVVTSRTALPGLAPMAADAPTANTTASSAAPTSLLRK